MLGSRFMDRGLAVSNPLTRKLERFVRMSAQDREALHHLFADDPRRFGAREDIVHEGRAPRGLHLMLSGWACRYKQLEDGRRQIVAFFLPGDLCDLHIHLLREMDHSLGTLTPATLAEVPHAAMEEIMRRHPRIARALQWEMLVSIAVQREWTVNLGQRSALERVAHLLCELFLRLRAVGLTEAGRCELPLTQGDLADATGLSAVHVNRTLQELRSDGLIVLKDRVLAIPNLPALMAAALFNPSYLHLDHEGRDMDANEP